MNNSTDPIVIAPPTITNPSLNQRPTAARNDDTNFPSKGNVVSDLHAIRRDFITHLNNTVAITDNLKYRLEAKDIDEKTRKLMEADLRVNEFNRFGFQVEVGMWEYYINNISKPLYEGNIGEKLLIKNVSLDIDEELNDDDCRISPVLLYLFNCFYIEDGTNVNRMRFNLQMPTRGSSDKYKYDLVQAAVIVNQYADILYKNVNHFPRKHKRSLMDVIEHAYKNGDRNMLHHTASDLSTLYLTDCLKWTSQIKSIKDKFWTGSPEFVKRSAEFKKQFEQKPQIQIDSIASCLGNFLNREALGYILQVRKIFDHHWASTNFAFKKDMAWVNDQVYIKFCTCYDPVQIIRFWLIACACKLLIITNGVSFRALEQLDIENDVVSRHAICNLALALFYTK